MSDSQEQPPAERPSPAMPEITPDDLARIFAASAVLPPHALPEDLPGRKKGLKKKLLVAVLVAAVGVGASFMSCVGQSFSYRQARALEGIEQQLKIRAGCVVAPSATPR